VLEGRILPLLIGLKENISPKEVTFFLTVVIDLLYSMCSTALPVT
jgi:hypothetical protein